MDGIIIIDTDILIDVGRSDITAVKRLEEEEKSAILGISVITQMELMVGCRNKKELIKLEIFLNRFTIFPLDTDISGIVIDLLRKFRLSHNLLIPDSLIVPRHCFIEHHCLPRIRRIMDSSRVYCFLNILSQAIPYRSACMR